MTAVSCHDASVLPRHDDTALAAPPAQATASTVVASSGATASATAVGAPRGPATGSMPSGRAEPKSLGARALRAAGWLVGGQLVSQALRLGSNLILTRLLLPEDFGLMAAVGTMYFALVMFSDLGVWQSVVKSPRGLDETFLGTAWTVQLARALLLALAVLAGAGALHVAAAAGAFAPGTVFADPRLPVLLAAIAPCALLQGAESMKLALAQRELLGGRLARLELVSQLVAAALTIALALATRSVWALMAGYLAAAAVRSALSHLLLPGPRVRPAWERERAREIVGFGAWILLSSVIGFAAAHGEKLLLGATLPSASFGVFSIAAMLVAALAGVVGSVNGHVVFAGLSQALRGSPQGLARAYARAQLAADLVLGVSAGLLLTAGPWAVWLLYDARFHAAGAMLQWLGLGLLAMRQQVAEQVMFAKGLPAWVSAANALRAAALVVAVPAGFAAGGEPGAIAGVVVAQFAGWPLSWWFRHRQRLLDWRTEAAWVPALALGAALGWVLDRGLRALFGAA